MSTPPAPADDAPRVLLFGHRGAGKSALVGALLKASETQADALRGELVAPPESLGGPHTELASFVVTLKPRGGGDPLTVILDDCAGAAAEALMEHPDPITQRAPGSALARAVVETDAIVLLVDASSTREELDEAFGEFEQFLSVVERAKTDARAVGGFPVSLVLTQCDRLAHPGDTYHRWAERVREREDAASKAFQEYLKEAVADDSPVPFLAFGSVHLDVFAVSIRLPPLDGRPDAGDRPHGVAELFRDCFAEAKAHHERVHRSERRLWWTVRLALTGLGFLLLLLGLVALFPPEASGPTLASKVDGYRQAERPAAVRLADDARAKNRTLLKVFASDGAFGSLDEDRQAFVTGRLKEIEDYEAYRAKLADAIAPASTRSLPELTKVRDTLRGELALPGEYSWGETAAGELRDKWLADVGALDAAQQALVEKYREYDRAGTALTLKRTLDESWLKEVDALFARAEKPPFPLNDPLPGSPVVNGERGEAVTYRVPFEFDEVYRARRYWEQTRDGIVHLRDLADALGLTAAPNRPPALLLLPEPNASDPAALATTRLAELARTYPRQSEGRPEWETRHFPDPIRSDLNARLQQSFAAGTRHVQRLFPANDTPAGWAALGASLAEPTFRDWGKLLHLLARLQEPTATDPVADLAGFLRDLDKKTFDLDPRGFELTIPLDLLFDRVEPTGPLTITVTHADRKSETAKFTVGKGETRGTATAYPLTPDGTTKLRYRPGDTLRAELPLKAGARELKLVWEAGGPNTFQFERLAREPRLTKPTGGTEPAPGVRLTLTNGTLPKLPVLVK